MRNVDMLVEKVLGLLCRFCRIGAVEENFICGIQIGGGSGGGLGSCSLVSWSLHGVVLEELKESFNNTFVQVKLLSIGGQIKWFSVYRSIFIID